MKLSYFSFVSRQRQISSPIYVWKINISNLLQNLQSQGIAADKVEEPGPGHFIIHLDKDEALIRIEDQETHVVCEDVKGSNTRDIIRQCIVSCLNTF